jgi:hypothetical protein
VQVHVSLLASTYHTKSIHKIYLVAPFCLLLEVGARYGMLNANLKTFPPYEPSPKFWTQSPRAFKGPYVQRTIILQCHTMKTNGRVELRLHLFLISALKQILPFSFISAVHIAVILPAVHRVGSVRERYIHCNTRIVCIYIYISCQFSVSHRKPNREQQMIF